MASTPTPKGDAQLLNLHRQPGSELPYFRPPQIPGLISTDQKCHPEHMKGFVPTPDHCVDWMVERLFERKAPTARSVVLDAGCGEGAFVAGVLRYCQKRGLDVPRIVAVDSDPAKLAVARRAIHHQQVTWRHSDFLLDFDEPADYVIGNPPYVSILGLDEAEKARYRERFVTAKGRFDLYFLFFERALDLVRPGGRVVFVTPEKFTYVDSAAEVRRLLSSWDLRRIRFVDEALFSGFTTYPAITVVNKRPSIGPAQVTLRDGTTQRVSLPAGGLPWGSVLRGGAEDESAFTLADICKRISCGIATGADQVFVRPEAELSPALFALSHPTVSGRDIDYSGSTPEVRNRMLVPYDHQGILRPLAALGPLASQLSAPLVRVRLEARTCTRRKPWYAFHETPVLDELLQPKILVKDITAHPHFVVDETGELLPRHSVYYIIPKDPKRLHDIHAYLGSAEARAWLERNCQRAANGFIRMQARVMQRLPIPDWLAAPSHQHERPLAVPVA